MISVFLIGGGWEAATFPQTYGRFLQSAAQNGERRIAIIVAEEPGTDPGWQFSRFFNAFERAGLTAGEAFPITISADNKLTLERLTETNPTGVFVCGGLTPTYYDALCIDRSWLGFLTENKIPYGGFSAGASIAAGRAVIGGWRRQVNEMVVEVTNENAGEDLDRLDVRSGLGLIDAAIDVHATQWGTLSRLIHAVEANLVETGWAIDENTMLEIISGRMEVHGPGNAYFVQKATGTITVEIFHQK